MARYYNFNNEDPVYYSSYEDLEVHKLMLEDEPRTEAYRKAILNNKSYFKDKVVMDVGCGTGILSIFCAQAGAKKVYAVEASNLAHLAKQIIRENCFHNVIEVINSRVEDVILPNNEKVDAIVSEWMGFYLLHEGMLDSVLIARDKFLKHGGEMFPESAVIYAAPCSIPSFYENWENYKGIAMSTFAEHLRATKKSKPEIMTITPKDLMGDEEALCWINLREDSLSSLDSYSLQHVVGASHEGRYEGICLWFECNFPDLTGGKEERIILDTSPKSPTTHWKQTIIILPGYQPMQEGEPMAFKVAMKRSEENPRRYNLEVDLLDPATVEHPLPCTCEMTKCILIRTFMNQQAEHAKESLRKQNSEEIIEDDHIDDDE